MAAGWAVSIRRGKVSALHGTSSEFHVLTYAEEGFSPLSIHAERFGLTREAVAKFAKTVNSQSEAGSLFPLAPLNQRGALEKFRGKRMRLICEGAWNQYAGRHFLAKSVRVQAK